MTSAIWLDARMRRMRAAEIRAPADDTNETEPKAIMLRIATITVGWPNGPKNNYQVRPFSQGLNAAKLLTRDEARWIAANIAKLLSKDRARRIAEPGSEPKFVATVSAPKDANFGVATRSWYDSH